MTEQRGDASIVIQIDWKFWIKSLKDTQAEDTLLEIFNFEDNNNRRKAVINEISKLRSARIRREQLEDELIRMEMDTKRFFIQLARNTSQMKISMKLRNSVEKERIEYGIVHAESMIEHHTTTINTSLDRRITKPRIWSSIMRIWDRVHKEVYNRKGYKNLPMGAWYEEGGFSEDYYPDRAMGVLAMRLRRLNITMR